MKKNIYTNCKIGAGRETCRYVTCGANGFECEKLTSLKHVLDARGDSMTARGDNCEGTTEPLNTDQLEKLT